MRLVHKYMKQVLTKPINKYDLFSLITFDDLRSSFDHLCASLSIYYQSERMQQCRTNQEYLPILGDSTCVEGPGVQCLCQFLPAQAVVALGIVDQPVARDNHKHRLKRG